MSTEAANYAYNLDHESLAVLLADYHYVVKGHHTPSVKSVKQVAAYLGHRQRYRPKYGGVCVDETIEQIAQATALRKDAVSDVLRFMETKGITETIRHGGGRSKLPTVRMLITDGANPDRLREELSGESVELSGESVELSGDSVELSGEFPLTPKVLPRRKTKRITISSDVKQSNSLRVGDVATESIDSILARAPSQMPDEVREQWKQFCHGLNRPRTSNGAQPCRK